MRAARLGARLLWVAGPAVVLVLWTGAGVGFLWASAEPAEREALAALLEPRAALVLMALLAAGLGLGVLGAHLHASLVAGPARLAERAQVLVASAQAPTPPPIGHPGVDALLGVVQALAAQREALRADGARRVAAASRDIEQERNRLAALMSELTQSVVVCNLDGRILLYNARARLQFQALSDTPDVAGGGGALLGLGRSIYAVFDRQRVAHALESIGSRLQRGAAQPSAEFLTSTRGGQLLRVQMAPVRAVAPDPQEEPGRNPPLAGFVLMLDNITRDFEEQSARDQMLHELSEGSRASLGALQAAVEMLEWPDLDVPSRERFRRVIREEVVRMADRLRDVTHRHTQVQKTRWPLADVMAGDFAGVAARRLEAGGHLRCTVGEVPEDLWLQVDSFSLLQALVYLGERLHEAYGIARVEIRLSRAERPGAAPRAHLDLLWTGQALSTETVMHWELDPMGAAGAGAGGSALTVRDVVDRHAGEFWFERERVRHAAFFRFLLPVPGPRELAEPSGLARHESRPTSYDFDLFAANAQAESLADTPLSDLTYTVFDTETTGLNPSDGDEILQIGATRIVAGKLRRHECFDQLVDPGRDIPAAGIPIHGIEPAMVAGQPSLAEVLPVFHAFARDTVLVAHNAAFDMRFLQLKEAATGVRFEQPVLDTLLLSAVVHPQQEQHGLDAIAERLGVTVLGRHTAWGDAIVTAEVFLKLLPLLAERGITTLGQAREAAQRTPYARLSY